MSTTATREQQIRELEVPAGTVAVVWLGQAGYLLKTSKGTIIMIDPYLTDWAETQWGLKRQIPVLTADQRWKAVDIKAKVITIR